MGGRRGRGRQRTRLRKAIGDAKGQQMPADTIQRAVKRGTGELEGVNYEEIVYEGTGPLGTLFLVESMTDNRNRTVAEIRKIFEKHNGVLRRRGHQLREAFERKGLSSTLEKAAATEDQLMEVGRGGRGRGLPGRGRRVGGDDACRGPHHRRRRAREGGREGQDEHAWRSFPRSRSRSPDATRRSRSTWPRRSTRPRTTCRTSTPDFDISDEELASLS